MKVAEVAGEVPRRGVAIDRVLAQATLDDPPQRGGGSGRPRRERLGLLAQDRRQGLRRAAAPERTVARQQLVHDRPERELVGPEIHGRAAGLLGRHVRRGPHHDAGRRLVAVGRWDLRLVVRAGLRELRETEVGDLREARSRDEDVFGLQIAVDDSLLVRGGESGRDLFRELERLPCGHRSFAEEAPEIRSVDELASEVEDAVRLPHVEDRHEVRIRERRRRAHFALEAPPAVRVARKRLLQDLDRHLPPESRVPGPIDLAHPARTDDGDHFIGSEA